MLVIYDVFFFFKQKTAYEMRISDWSSDVCSSDLHSGANQAEAADGAGLVFRRFGGNRDILHRRPRHGEVPVMWRQRMARLAGRIDELRPVQVRQIVNGPQRRGLAVRLGGLIVGRVAAADNDGEEHGSGGGEEGVGQYG